MHSWLDVLPETAVSVARDLSDRAAAERQSGKTIYPEQSCVFRALQLTPPEKLKVFVIGQDPYHGAGQANGLAFSVNSGTKFPPSLRNIFKELVNDIGCSRPSSGDLTPWAEQGVLLLNTGLTVEEGRPNSHARWGWSVFTKAVFQAALELPQPIVFFLWGKNAQDFVSDLDVCRYPNKKFVISTHPSPLSASRSCGDVPAFLGSKPFSTANRILVELGETPVRWEI